MIGISSKISIRAAVPSDVPRIAEMMRSVSAREHSVDAVRAMTVDFAPGEFYAWLAEAGDEPVGLTMLEPCTLEHRGAQTKAGYWRYLWVSSDQRKTGLYPRLVFTMIGAAAKAGIGLVYGAIRRPEVAAGHLALGMQKVGDMPVFAKPVNPATLFSKFHGLGNFATGLSAFPDFVYRQYLSARHLAAGAAYTITDVSADQADLQAVIPALREMHASDLQRPLTSQYFLKRYRMNSDGNEYRVLGVQGASEQAAAIVYRTAVRGNNIQALIILEMGYRSGDRDALRFGLVELEKRAIALRCEVILVLSSSRGIQQLLDESGYFKSTETYVLMKKSTRPEIDGVVTGNLDDWYFTFSDHDAF
jgi:hypothetical protein